MEVMRVEHIADPAIKTFHHAGLGRPGLGQAMLDPQRLAQLVKLMFTGRLTILRSKQAVSEFLAVVCQ